MIHVVASACCGQGRARGAVRTREGPAALQSQAREGPAALSQARDGPAALQSQVCTRATAAANLPGYRERYTVCPKFRRIRETASNRHGGTPVPRRRDVAGGQDDDVPQGNARRPSLRNSVIRDHRAAGVLLAPGGLAAGAGHDQHRIGGNSLAGLNRPPRRSSGITVSSPMIRHAPNHRGVA